MKNILITGASGFIGSNLCDILLEEGFNVYGTYRKTKITNPAVIPVQCDLSKGLETNYQIDAIIHGASAIRSDNPNIYIDDCILSTRNLINFAEKQGVKKFIFFSSIAVYGTVNGEVNVNSDRINPDEYGASKFLCEKMLAASKIEAIYNLRLTRLLGKNIDFSYPWLPALSYKLLNNKDITYFNPEMLYNNLSHTKDLGQFIIALLKRQGGERQTAALGAKDKRRIIDIINILKENLNSKSQLTQIQAPLSNTCYSVDISQALALGYNPMTVEGILKQYCDDITL